jgi:ligand-binding sensor domain-containing protein
MYLPLTFLLAALAANDPQPTTRGVVVSELSKSIWSIFQDQHDNHWFGSNGDGVYCYDGKTLVRFTTNDGLPDNKIRGIQGDKSGNVFINTPKGVSKFDGRTFTTLTVAEGDASKNGWKIQPDDLWFAGDQDTGAVFRYDGQSLYRLPLPRTPRGDEHLRKFPRSQYPNIKSSPYDVYTIYRDRRGHMWFGTATLGACRFDGQSFDWFCEDHLTNAPNGGSFGIRSIIEDRDGKFWICNTQYRFAIAPNAPAGNTTGLVQYRREPGAGDLKARIGEPYLYFQSVVADKAGHLWLAPWVGGVWRWDGQSLTHYPVKEGARDVKMISIFQDRRGDLWLGTQESGAFKFNGQAFEPFKP